MRRFQWQRGPRLRSAAPRLLRLWIRIPPGGNGGLSAVNAACCQEEVSALGLVTCPVESYRVWCVQCVWSRSCVREVMARNRAETPDTESLAEYAWKKEPERNRRTLPFQNDWSVTWYRRRGSPSPPSAAMFVTFITFRTCCTENNELWVSRLCDCPHPYSLVIRGFWNKNCELFLH